MYAYKEAPNTNRMIKVDFLWKKNCILPLFHLSKWNALHSSQLVLHFSPLFFLGHAVS